jgi:transposase-like protein
MADTDNGSLGKLEYDEETGHFQAAAFAPSATIHAHQFLRNFVAFDACHTKSKYPMTLMIAVGIDANNNAIPLAWALVPTESEEWWTWFCNFLKEAFNDMSQEGYVFISDRDKGLAASVCTVFPRGCPAHCCQHIADNVQTNFGVKCRPLFWQCAWVRDQKSFKSALEDLRKVNLKAA